MTAAERLVATATDQVGYIGKLSNAQLDSFTANPGGKYNKYARDLDALKDFYNYPKQGYDWCDIFVDWCFVKTFGRELAQKLLVQPNNSCGAGTAYSLGYYKAAGQFFSTPQIGDQIFFGDSRSTWHTGIVTAVSGDTICTVEGNSGSPLGVHGFRYSSKMSTIKGYGRPDWSLVTSEVPKLSETPSLQPLAVPTVYATIYDVPEYYKEAVQKVMNAGALKGTGSNQINVSEDLCRILTILDRLGKLN